MQIYLGRGRFRPNFGGPAARQLRRVVLPRLMAVAFAAAGTLSGATAKADVWGYVDENGRSHVATEKLDDRYTLFFKGGVRAEQPAAESAKPAAAPEQASAPTSRHTARFEPLIKQYATLHNVDPALVKAVIAVESAFQPSVVSAKGALGLMQIIPGTGERYGVVGDRKKSVAEKLSDPETNVRVGTRYLRDLLGMFKQNVELALAAYNAGEGSVQRHNNKVPPFPETRDYVKKVQKLYADFRPAPAPVVAAAPAVPQPVRFVIPGQRVATSLPSVGLIPVSLNSAAVVPAVTTPSNVD